MAMNNRFFWSLGFGIWSFCPFAAFAATFTVNMSGFQFVPRDLTVNAGDTVTWVNQDFTLHDTTSGTNGVASGLWHSPLFGNGGFFSLTFNFPPGHFRLFFPTHLWTFDMVR